MFNNSTQSIKGSEGIEAGSVDRDGIWHTPLRNLARVPMREEILAPIETRLTFNIRCESADVVTEILETFTQAANRAEDQNKSNNLYGPFRKKQ